jgi:hypothetical protein
VNLFINYFDHIEPERKKEIEFCLEKNQENKYIKNIIIVNRNKRCTYGDFLSEMWNYNDINIIANCDIFFDDTLKYVNGIKKGECYALTRWEYINGKVMSFNDRHGRPSPPQWSQDAWIFNGSISASKFYNVKATNLNTNRSEIIPFSLGIPGCDNKFAAMLKQSGVKVTNPSLDIRAIHVHRSNSRIYPRYQILSGIRPNGLVYQSHVVHNNNI